MLVVTAPALLLRQRGGVGQRTAPLADKVEIGPFFLKAGLIFERDLDADQTVLKRPLPVDGRLSAGGEDLHDKHRFVGEAAGVDVMAVGFALDVNRVVVGAGFLLAFVIAHAEIGADKHPFAVAFGTNQPAGSGVARLRHAILLGGCDPESQQEEQSALHNNQGITGARGAAGERGKR